MKNTRGSVLQSNPAITNTTGVSISVRFNRDINIIVKGFEVKQPSRSKKTCFRYSREFVRRVMIITEIDCTYFVFQNLN